MDFNSLNLEIREAANGTLALSALLLIVIFGHYCWINRQIFRRSGTTQAATAILILMVGHFVRSTGTWVEYLTNHVELHMVSSNWIKWSWIWFMTAVIVIIFGKMAMIYIFAPVAWRSQIIAVGIPLCFAIPVVVARFF